MRKLGLIAVVLLGTSCGPVPAGSEGGLGSPDACGNLKTSDMGRRIYEFLVASAELDRASVELEKTVMRACRNMGQELAISVEGNTSEVCSRVNAALRDSLQVSVSQEQRLVTRTKPPVCKTEVDFAANVAAQCEAKASADIGIICEGKCTGTCDGRCYGTCDATAADGSCEGQCPWRVSGEMLRGAAKATRT